MGKRATTKKPEPEVTGGKNSYIRCPYPDCVFFCRQYNLYNGHLQEIHQCANCGLYCPKLSAHECKKSQTGGSNQDAVDTSVFSELSRAHRGAVRSYIHNFDKTLVEVPQAFSSLMEPSVRLVSQLLKIFGNLKLILKLTVLFSRRVFNSDGSVDEIEQVAYLTNTVPVSIYAESEIENAIAFLFHFLHKY